MTRRQLLTKSLRISAGVSTMPLWMRVAGLTADAQTGGGYKAIICISLLGGNDGNNMIVPLDAAGYGAYYSARQELAIPQNSLLPVQSADSGKPFGLHPSLANIGKLFNQGKAEFILNCGPMDQPLTKATLRSNPSLLPESFGSHPVSVAQWESATTLTNPGTGWGGRIADQIAGLSGSVPPVLSVSGVSTFAQGISTQGFSVIGATANELALPSDLIAQTATIATRESSVNNRLVEYAAGIRSQAIGLRSILQQTQQAGSPISTVFPTSTLGQSLLTVVELISGRNITGANRQLFYCATGGFDTHSAQLNTHGDLLNNVDACIGSLVAALQEVGMLDQVAVVTLSDFGRTFQLNTSAGTDHAWGNHQIVLGGGFSGGRVIGAMPDFSIGGGQDYTGQGVWIPNISTVQVVGSLASWFGLSTNQVATVVPMLSNFPAGSLAL